jgi:hypothetical protein
LASSNTLGTLVSEHDDVIFDIATPLVVSLVGTLKTPVGESKEGRQEHGRDPHQPGGE